MSYDIYNALGLTSNPFSPATSTKGYFYTQASQRILEEIQFGIVNRRGFILLVGEVGVGKTSLLLQLLDELHNKTNGSLHTSWVFNTVLDRTELLHTIASDFGLEPEPNANFSELLALLNKFFLDINSEEGNCAIIVDEAHNLDGQTLESLRLLSNLESDEKKLVQIVLSGQPELESRLNQPEFRQLRSRIAIFNVLPPLQKNELKRYVDYKLSKSKARLSLPSRAVGPLFDASQGNLRLINLIMERSLHVMYALDQTQLEPGTIRKAIKEVSSFQKELRQRHSNKRWKNLAVASLMLLLVATGIYLFMPGAGRMLHQWLNFTSPASQHVQEQAPAMLSIDRTADNTKVLDAEAFNQEMENFLGPFDQENLATYLAQAMQVNSVEVLQARLPHELQVFGTNHLPANLDDINCTTFPWQKYTESPPGWILLWEPPVKVVKFHPDYSGPEIGVIQKRLHELDYYDDNLDGYLGSGTWRAITAFQETYGLELTGIPDPETIFWLFSGARSPEQDEDGSKP